RLALLLAATLVSGLAARAFAGMIEGDGKGKAANNCLVELSVQVSPLPAGPKMTCNDCDAGCDLDQTPDGVCTLQVALCVNQTNDSGCTPVELKKAIGKVMGVKGLKMLPAPSSLAGDPSCGAFASNFQLKLGGKKKNRPKTAVVVLTGISTGKRKARRVDTDHFVLTCKPHPAGTDCPPPPTVTTTTIPVVCGDGPREGDEEKDDGGNVLPDVCAGGSFAGQPCTTTSDCTGGICSQGRFTCGGLYFGGGGVSVPLPSVVPDMSSALSKVTACTNNCTLTLGATTQADTGSDRTCTSAGCKFGPPLPVTNPPQAQLSTCIINEVAQDAAGVGDCRTGETSALSVPLNSKIFLTGNLLAFRCRGGTRAGEPCTGVADTACAPGTCEDDRVARRW